MPEVLTATELEGLVAGVIIPELREPADSPVGDDVEQPQEPTMPWIRPEVLVTQGRKA